MPTDFRETLNSLKEELSAREKGLLLTPPPEKLYHYTSVSTLQKILEGKSIWATEGLYMNDSSELRHSAAVILEMAARLEPEFDHRAGRTDVFGWLRGIVRTAAEDRLNLMFLASFSEHNDSLSQWRAYADNGAGVAIEFDLRSLTSATYPPMADHLAPPVVLRCLYDKRQQCELIERILRPLAETTTGDPEFRALKQLGLLMNSVAQDFSPFLKNPGFHEEAEWRIMVQHLNERVSKAMKFRNTKYGPAPFVEVPVGSGVGVPITGITFGPRVQPAAKRSVRLLLDRDDLIWVKTRDAQVSYQS